VSGQHEDLERRLWLEGPAAYRELLADDAVVVVPMQGGILDRDGCLAAIAQAPRWRRVEFRGAQLASPGIDLTLLVYRAEAARDGTRWAALCSSLWRETAGGPRLVLHQQTPLP
jgi:Domain of unknown function (DUF4440)